MKRSLFLLALLALATLTFAQTDSRFGVKIGYSVIQHLEPQISGQSMTTQINSTEAGVLSGLETMNGIDLKVQYFFLNNLGVYANLGFGNSSNSVEFENPGDPFIQYQAAGSYVNASIGAAPRFSFGDVPANLILGTSIGYYGYEMDYSQTANGLGQWYTGTHQILKVGLEAMVEYEVFKGLNLFTELNYSTQLGVDGDNWDLQYTDDNGDFYSIVYNSPSLAALRLTLGLGYNFWKRDR